MDAIINEYVNVILEDKLHVQNIVFSITINWQRNLLNYHRINDSSVFQSILTYPLGKDVISSFGIPKEVVQGWSSYQ